jgi:hypothetical protein
MLKKFMSDSKEKNKLEIVDNWLIFKEKNKIVFKFFIAIMKLFSLVFVVPLRKFNPFNTDARLILSACLN